MTLRGMDISAYQNPTPSLAGLDFVCVKATQNTTEDPMWREHSANVRAAGLFLIAYHFGEEAPVGPQVARFISVAQWADAWVLDRDPTYYSSSMQRWVHQPEKGTCRDFINSMAQASYPCGLYFNCANYVDVGQVWNWQASPPDFCPSIPWDIYQAHSGVPGGDILSRHSTLDELIGGTGVQRFVVTSSEPHNIIVRKGSRIFDLGGQFVRQAVETKPQIGLVQGQLSKSDATYWVFSTQIGGDKQLALIRRNDVTDQGAVDSGGGGGGHSGKYDDGYAAAKGKAIAAVESL